MLRAILILAALLLMGCTSAQQQQIQIQTANALALGANAALPVLVAQYRAEGIEIINAASSREEATASLTELKSTWEKVWLGWESVRTAHAAWATALEQGGNLAAALSALRVAYCGLLQRWPKGVPALPLAPVACTVGGGP